jgi:tRNA(Ile)-lysidine synthase
VERPFLGVPRSTVISALSAWGAEYRLDSSNDDPRFTRNRVRADVLPALRALNPRVTARLATTADILRADAEYIETQANRALGALFLQREPQSVTISRAGWAALHPALARGVARAAIRSLLGDVVDIDEKHIAEIVQVVLDGKPMRLHLPRDLQLRVDDYTVYLRIGSLPQRPPIEEARLKVPGSVSTEAGTLTGSLLEGLSEDDLHRLLTVAGPLHVLLDATLAGTSLLVRRRQPGDRVKPSGSRVTRKVQDVLVDGYVPRQIRGSIPIIANDRHILWIPGLVVDRRAAAMSRNPILHLAWQPNLPDIA